jgi:hypothetical protein
VSTNAVREKLVGRKGPVLSPSSHGVHRGSRLRAALGHGQLRVRPNLINGASSN